MAAAHELRQATAPEIEHLLRTLAPEVLARLARRFRDFEATEDAVQEALLVASEKWRKYGLPESPLGWLMQVAKRRHADMARAELARRRREVFVVMQPDAPLVASPDEAEGDAGDETLALLFLCCHPSLTRSSAIALTLRAVGGLTTAEIAAAYLVPEPTMGQRISRAKATIKNSGVGFEMPNERERAARLGAVLHVLYLIFSEGHAPTGGTELARPDLSSEAIRLARLVHRLLPDETEAAGLLALLLLTDARRAARVDASGELVALDEQDRTLWNAEAIREGTELLSRTLPAGRVGPYQLQAAIAALHDEAESTETTDWPQILALYDVLLRITENPVVLLNHAVAFAMVHGPRAGLERLRALDADPRFEKHHRLAAVRGHLHERAGEPVEAERWYRAALEWVTNVPEKNHLLFRLARLRAASSSGSR